MGKRKKLINYFFERSIKKLKIKYQTKIIKEKEKTK